MGMSLKELCAKISENTNLDQEEVTKIVQAFLDLFLIKFKLI